MGHNVHLTRRKDVFANAKQQTTKVIGVTEHAILIQIGEQKIQSVKNFHVAQDKQPMISYQYQKMILFATLVLELNFVMMLDVFHWMV